MMPDVECLDETCIKKLAYAYRGIASPLTFWS